MAQATNPLNATYWIDEFPVNLRNGRAEQVIAPGSAIKSKTSVVGRPVTGDLDGDGIDDAVLLLVHDPGGSGTFFYLAAALNRQGRFAGTRAVLLGDRIEPLSIVLEDGVVTVRWKQHATGQPMSASPSAEMNRRLAVDKSEPAFLKQVDD